MLDCTKDGLLPPRSQWPSSPFRPIRCRAFWRTERHRLRYRESRAYVRTDSRGDRAPVRAPTIVARRPVSNRPKRAVPRGAIL
jgi:hypothetical protein